MRRYSKNLGKVATVSGVILIALVVVAPILWTIHLSLKPQSQMFIVGIKFPIEITFDNYRTTFNSTFLGYIWNGLIVGLLTALISVILGAPAAYSLAFSNWSVKIKEKYMYIILLLRMASPIAFAIPIFIAYTKTRLIDTHLGLLLAYLTFSLPLAVWLMWMFFLDVPPAVLEAGMIDGASVFTRFTKIALPLCAPGVFTAAILTFGACWNDFFFALVLTRYDANTGTVGVMNFLKYSGYDWGGITSACILLMIPAIPIAIFMQKYLAQGITAGAVKQ